MPEEVSPKDISEVAYRCDGEQAIDPEGFIWVECEE